MAPKNPEEEPSLSPQPNQGEFHDPDPLDEDDDDESGEWDPHEE